MAANENEEFEFRLRAEQEAAKPKLADGLDTSSLDAFRASVRQKPVKQPKGDFPGSNLIGDVEAAGALVTGALSPVTALGPIIKDVVTGATTPERGDQKYASAMDRATYSPRTIKGKERLQSAGEFIESSGIAGIPPMLGIPRAGVDISRKLPKPAPAAAPKASPAAAVNELQAQRGVMGGEKVRDLNQQSAYESALLERDKQTVPLREFAFKMPDRAQTKDIHSLIDKLTEANPDKRVRAALKEVRQTLKNAEEASGKSSLPPAGARLSATDFKKLSGQQGSLSVAQLDEVRQSIGRMLDETGDKKLDGHTAALLMNIRDKLVESAPENYRAYLQEYERLSKPLDQFKAAGNARDMVTADKAAFHMLNESDKQNMLESAFKSAAPGRALAELVRDTKHSPEALDGVRQSYANWLTQPDAMTQKPTAKGLVKRWEDTKAAVKSSGLMTESHIADMEKIMVEVRDYEKKNRLGKAWASTAGFFIGQSVGHPITGAHLARDVVVSSGKQSASKALETVMHVAANPNGAAILASPPTRENVEKLRLMLPTDIAAVIIPNAARAEQVRRGADPLSMQPAGF